MRNFYMVLGVALSFGGAGLAFAAGGVSPSATLGMTGARSGANVGTTTNNNGVTPSGNSAVPGNGAASLPPPPPANLTMPPAAQGVPPTPAPAFPGLPSLGASAATPNSTGLPNQTINDLRQTQNASGPVDVAAVQAALANGGFYKGPIDGTLAGPTRASVRAFQEANALPPTGQLDPQTVAALGVVSFAPSAQAASGLTGAASPNANGNATTTTTATNGIGANSSLNGAGGVTATPTTGVGTPTVPSPGVTGGNGSTQRTTTSEPFPLSVPRPAAPFQSSPIFIQP